MEPINYERHKVYDGVLRLIHAWNGLAVLFLLLTALLSDWFPKTTGEIVHVDGGVHAMGA